MGGERKITVSITHRTCMYQYWIIQSEVPYFLLPKHMFHNDEFISDAGGCYFLAFNTYPRMSSATQKQNPKYWGKKKNISRYNYGSWDLNLAQGHCSGCYSLETNPQVNHAKNHSSAPKTPKTNQHSLSLENYSNE